VGVKSLRFQGPSPAVVIDKDRTLVLVSSPTNADEHFVAVALAGDGQIVSLGVSLWWSWVGEADNATLLENMLRKQPKAEVTPGSQPSVVSPALSWRRSATRR
jgi:hypothetical protein